MVAALEALDGLDLEYAKASRFDPLGLSVLLDPLDPTNELHPLHLAVICQCVPFTLEPVLRICRVAPVKSWGAWRTLFF